jgi:hypothetical protein
MEHAGSADVDRAGRHREALLEAARDLSREERLAGGDPGRFVGVLKRAWEQLDGPPTSFDPDFCVDLHTGVEALAFVVHGEPAAGGLVLRLAGEHPDSFERIAVPAQGGASPEEVRLAFFLAAGGS